VSRTMRRTLVAATIAAATLLAGCSLIPGLGSSKPDVVVIPPKPASSATATASKPASGTTAPKPKPKPAVSTTTSGTASVVPGLPAKPRTLISSDIDGVELRDLVAKGAYLVDLRSKADFRVEHISGATNVPMASFVDTAKKWSRSRAVIVYDKTGAQGQAAQSWLERNGFTAVYHLFRGLDGYDDTLVGKNPTPIPPKEPVLYYFYATPSSMIASDAAALDIPSINTATAFTRQLRTEFGGRFEYRPYDISTIAGMSQFLDFGGMKLPMWRLVTEDGTSEQYVGTGTMQTIRAHLKRAIDGYRHDTEL
jgi:phage shock protein E